MAFTHSRSAIDLKLEIYEVEALIDWHRGNEFSAADDQEYQQAANSKQRRETLEQQLYDHRERLKADALEITKKNLAAQLTNGERG